MGNQVIWPDATDPQKYALAIVPKLTSFLSILGSCYIIADICRLKRRNTYHRIILGMNVVDLMSLVAWFFTTWPIPKGTYGVMGALGNQQTCDAQGFFSQLSIATVMYNVCLAIYFMLVIRHGWTEKRIADVRLEQYFHTLCWGVGIGTAVIALVLELYNPAGWQCWIAVAPTGCAESWEWDGNNEQRNRWLQPPQELETLFVNATNTLYVNDTTTPYTFTATTMDPYEESCVRGDNANLYVWFLFYVPLWTSIIIASGCLYQVYSAYHKQDLIVEKWRQKLVTTASGASGKVLGAASKRLQLQATKSTHKLTDVAKRPFVLTRQGSKRKRTAVTQPRYTPAQKKKILEKQRSRSPTHFQQQQGTMADVSASSNCSYRDLGRMQDVSQQSHGTTRMQDVSQQSHYSTASTVSHSGRLKNLPPVLGSKPYTGRTHHPKIDELMESSQQSNNNNCSNNSHRRSVVMAKLGPMLRRTGTAEAANRRQQQNAKSKLVTSQAILYLCSFYVAWAFPSILRIQESTAAEGVAFYHWMFLSAFFCPLQGLMNFVVYIRPKYLAVRRQKQRVANLAKQQKKMEDLKGQNSYYRDYYKSSKDADKSSTVGTVRGSSSALFTTQSEDAVADSKQLSQQGLGMISSHHNDNKPFENKQLTIVEVEGLPSSSSSDESSSSDDDDYDEDVIAVWSQAEQNLLECGGTARKEKGPVYEHQPSMQEEAVTDLFDALQEANESLQFSLPGSLKGTNRPRFFRSNSDGHILAEQQQVSQFHSSVVYDGHGHVVSGRQRSRTPPPGGETGSMFDYSFTSLTKSFGKSISNIMQRASPRGTSSNHSQGSSSVHRSGNNAMVHNQHDFFDNSSLSFGTGLESFQTSRSGAFRSSNNTSGGLSIENSWSAGNSSFQTARSPSGLSPTLPSMSLHSSQTAGSGHTMNSFGASQLLATSIVEDLEGETTDDQEEEDILGPEPPSPNRPSRSSNPHPIDSGNRVQFHNFRRNRKQQEMERLHHSADVALAAAGPPDRMERMHHSTSEVDGGPMLDMPPRISAPELGSKQQKKKKARRRDANDAPPPPSRKKGVSFRRSPMVQVDLDSGDLGVGGDGASSDDGGGVFSVTSSVNSKSKKLFRRNMMKKAKSTWTSSKKGAQLVKDAKSGAKSGIRSIRNFASTFADVLTADADALDEDWDDDWATALDESDIMARFPDRRGVCEEGEKDHQRRSNSPLEQVAELSGEVCLQSSRSHDDEEEKEEVDAFAHGDSFECEHD